MKLLLIEDDPQTAALVAKGFREHDHVIDIATEGRQGLFLSTSGSYDVVIVDRRLPGLDGLSIVRAIRAADIKVPILFLTTVSGIEDRVVGLEAGGDDYLVKPFHFSELLARANALARRPPISTEQTVLRVADLEMDLLRRRVLRNHVEIDLLPREFALLHYLMKNAERIVTRAMLLEHVWDFHFDPKTSIVETHISRLRVKIDKPFDKPLIHTVHRSGYSLHA
jgi:two-component system OmpR family response regulator